MTDQRNICYCGEYGGGVHTRSARCPGGELRTLEGEPALTQSSGLPGTREPVVIAPQGNAGESPPRLLSSNEQVPNPDGIGKVVVGLGWYLPWHAINDLQRQSVDRLIKRSKAAHYTNVRVRINGNWEESEADWIKHMVRSPADETSPDSRDAARYRYLRRPGNAIVYAKDRHAWGQNASGHVRYDTAEQLDSAVDAAMGSVVETTDEPMPERCTCDEAGCIKCYPPGLSEKISPPHPGPSIAEAFSRSPRRLRDSDAAFNLGVLPTEQPENTSARFGDCDCGQPKTLDEYAMKYNHKIGCKALRGELPGSPPKKLSGPLPDRLKALVKAGDQCPAIDDVHTEHQGKCVYCGAPMSSQSNTDPNPLDPTNQHFRKCLKGHVSFAASFPECPSCKVERERNAQKASADEIGNHCKRHPAARYVLKYGCPSCSDRLPTYSLPNGKTGSGKP